MNTNKEDYSVEDQVRRPEDDFINTTYIYRGIRQLQKSRHADRYTESDRHTDTHIQADRHTDRQTHR